MRGILIKPILLIACAFSIATPATALGLGDLAKTVLSKSSVLKKGEEKCGTSLGLTKDDLIAITLARSAVEQALPLSQFVALDQATQAEATSASTAPTFCNETKKKKSGLMSAMSKAGKAILKKKALGSLGL